MFINPDKRQRHAFIESSIDAVRDEFANNPHLQEHLGSKAAYFTGLCDRLFVPNIKNSQVGIPKKHRDGNGLPIIALQSHELGVYLVEEFSLFYPLQRERIRQKLGDWGVRGSVASMEEIIQSHVRREAVVSPHYVANACGNVHNAGAFIAQPSRDFDIDLSA